MAWAVLHDYYDIDGSYRPYLLGYGYFGWDRPVHLGGYKTATFATHKLARSEAKSRGKGYRAVRVKIKVECEFLDGVRMALEGK